MKIEYKILWLDDKIKEFIDDEIVFEVSKHLKNNGFRPKIDTASDFTTFKQHLDENEYDLILTDYHMGDVNGEQVVEFVRDNSILTEILFYTAQADLVDASKISRVSFLETKKKNGTHSTILLNETKKLIDLTIKKFQNIVAMRGMIMHETSYLDSEMLSIINQYSTNDVNREKMIQISEDIFDGIFEHMEMKKEQLDDLHRKNNFNRLRKDNYLFSADFKIKTLKCIINNLGCEDFTDSYKKDINNIRNKFAHAVLEKGANGKEQLSFGKIIFDDELCKKIRQEIIDHSDKIESLKVRIAETG